MDQIKEREHTAFSHPAKECLWQTHASLPWTDQRPLTVSVRLCADAVNIERAKTVSNQTCHRLSCWKEEYSRNNAWLTTLVEHESKKMRVAKVPGMTQLVQAKGDRRFLLVSQLHEVRHHAGEDCRAGQLQSRQSRLWVLQRL